MEATLATTERLRSTTVPARRPDLVLRALEGKRCVVKDPRSGSYFDLGEEEHFLLDRLDGLATGESVRQAFEDRFGQPLSDRDLQDFLALARAQDFLAPARRNDSDTRDAYRSEPAERAEKPPASPVARRKRTLFDVTERILFWRVSLFDPDRFLNWLTPRLWFCWTRGFLIASLLTIMFAAGIVWTHWNDLVSQFSDIFNWRTIVVVWLTLLAVTTMHEFAHGATCKRYGGEVHEVGFLLIFFIPCLYCNVSDAWLFRERSKRLWVALAGGYLDLCLWAVAVLIWRVTLPNSFPNYVAWVVLSVVAARILFNFNPLLKLDGYYLLSDWKGIANLQQRSADRFKQQARRLLWGGQRPAPDPHGHFLSIYGLVSWLFTVMFLAIMLTALFRFVWTQWGLVAFVVVAPLAILVGHNVLSGLGGGEIQQMIGKFRKRTIIWSVLLTGIPLALAVIHMDDRVEGAFQVRPVVRTEVRATLTAFVREVHFSEGDHVSPGAVIARLEIPDLTSRTAQKRAEVGEAEAKLRLAEAGSRPEELLEHRQRVERARTWRGLAEQDLLRARTSTREDLARLDKSIVQCEAEEQFAFKAYDRIRKLREQSNASDVEFQEASKHLEVEKAKADQARSLKRATEAVGTKDAENELARRVKELADAEGTLAILEAGTRPEEIEAARAHLARAREELRYLDGQQEKLLVVSPVGGVIMTPRLKEKVGHYVREGELICQVEDPQTLEAEIMLTEQDVSRIAPDFAVELKARALPFETFTGRVGRIAPSVVRAEMTVPVSGSPVTVAAQPVRPDLPGSVVVYCRLETISPHLRSGMTGSARVSCGQRPIGEILYNRAARFLRTEFWW